MIKKILLIILLIFTVFHTASAQGITYQVDCHLNATNKLEKFFCGDNYQQTRFNKVLYLGILPATIILGIVVTVSRRKK